MRIISARRLLALSICVLAHMQVVFGECHSSHSVFVPRSITHDSVYELALANYDFYHHAQDACGRLDVYLTPFYQRSFRSDKTASYFLPRDCQTISIRQDGLGDVNPVWFGLVDADGNYESTLGLNPKRSVYGLSVALFKDFSDYCDGAWANIVFTPMRAKTELNLCETNITGSGLTPGISNMIDALNNPELQYGKYSDCTLSHSGLDDIQLKLGYNWFCNDHQEHKGVYLVGTIPTGSKPCNEFIFDPRIGTRHGAIGFGVNTDHIAWERWNVHYMMDFKFRYLFSGRECRSFDLCENGQWSRFLQTVTEDQRSDSHPGINTCFTRQVKVTPRCQIDWWNALHWNDDCGYHYEVGFDFWWRQAEDISLYRCDCCTEGIYDIVGDAARQNAQNQQLGAPISASTANISQAVTGPNQARSDLQFTQVGNLDLASGAHPRAVSGKIYASYAYEGHVVEIPTFLGLGAALEFGASNSALSNWSLWAKWGLNF